MRSFKTTREQGAPPKRRRFDLIGSLIVLASLAIPIGVIIVARHRAASPPDWASDVDAQGNLRPLAEVLKATREAKLITLSIDSTVRATVVDDRWYGTASATLVAPVRYGFGVSLDKLDDGALRYDFLTSSYVITVPPPDRLTCEVDAGHLLEEKVEATGTRFKKLAGREAQVQALKLLSEEALRQTLPEAQRRLVRDATRQQVQRLVANILGGKYAVRVAYSDE